MAISIFDMFKIGVGPSSSHTVGPMKAANMFVEELAQQNVIDSVEEIQCELFGSLGATGKGHSTDTAVKIGLEGYTPELVQSEEIEARIRSITATELIFLNQDKWIRFFEEKHMLFKGEEILPGHPNAMTLTASNAEGTVINSKTYYSVGGGFVIEQGKENSVFNVQAAPIPYPFNTAEQLLAICNKTGYPIHKIMLANECAFRDEVSVLDGINEIWGVMTSCIDRGLTKDGILPGGLSVKRRAPQMHRDLCDMNQETGIRHLDSMAWVNLYAISVNEENAAGGKVVTAPTNGAAGIIPAVIKYYLEFCNGNEAGVIRFMLSAAAIGMLCKTNASISGAEVGCQGEVGSACAMAAAGLAEAVGATPEQVENAAEIGMEHNLGLTCDPVGGLVQVPCIERNAMAAVKAINAVSMALKGDGSHFVSLDTAIKTMRDTGKDMLDKYKETSRGGLAVNVIEC